MVSPALFQHPEFDDEEYGDGEAYAVQAGRHLQELQRLSAFQQVTTKVPPAYDGRSSWFAYEPRSSKTPYLSLDSLIKAKTPYFSKQNPLIKALTPYLK